MHQVKRITIAPKSGSRFCKVVDINADNDISFDDDRLEGL